MKVLLPVLILLGAALGSTALIMLKPEAEVVSPERPVTQVEIVTVQPETVALSVWSQGTVLPRTETVLSVEVAGRIIEVADSFRPGGYFEEGDLLFRIDPADYRAALATRAAELAQARLTLAQELALAEQAAADWQAMGKGEASDLTLRKPQLAQAEAMVESAQANLDKAKRDLKRTEIQAPYKGRVLSKSVDLGQFVTATPTNPVAQIYATDFAEIRLPLTKKEASFIDTRTREIKMVRVYDDRDQEEVIQIGRFARLEATLDPESRLLYAVAEIADPFNPNSDDALRRGQFVAAEIEARTVDQAYVLPRYALRGSDTVYLLTNEQTLRTQKVGILKSDAKNIIITEGLKPGDQVVISPIAYYIENMPVELINVE